MPLFTEHEATQNEFIHLQINPGDEETIELEDIQDYHEGTDSLNNKIARFRFNGKNLVNTYLPLEANPREPGSSTAVTRMRLTLKETAETFHLKNNGLTIFASSVEFEENKENTVTMKFDRGNQGICNGGHTYFTIATALSRAEIQAGKDFYVNCEVIVHPAGMGDEEIRLATVEISRARNTNSQLKPFSMADQLGFFDQMQEIMGENKNLVSWHENDSSAVNNAIQVTELLRYLACLSPDMFAHSYLPSPNSNHKPASTGSKAKIWDPWFTKCENGERPILSSMYPMIIEIISLKEYIAERILTSEFPGNFRMTNLWQIYMGAGNDGQTRKSLLDQEIDVINLGVTVEIMILGLLRDNVARVRNNRGKTTMIGWYRMPQELVDLKLDTTMSALASVFLSSSNDAKAFIRADSAYSNQMIKWDPALEFIPNDPVKLVDIETLKVYMSETNADVADHILEPQSGRMIACEDGNQNYKEIRDER
jgi:hypothetical protein